jgi:di/tricarboxylate transporter
MSLENTLVLITTVVAVLLFITEHLRVDVVAMLVLTLLIITGLVTVEEVFSGFFKSGGNQPTAHDSADYAGCWCDVGLHE